MVAPTRAARISVLLILMMVFTLVFGVSGLFTNLELATILTLQRAIPMEKQAVMHLLP